MRQILGLTVLLWGIRLSPALAQDGSRVFVGGLFGVSTLSADAGSLVTPSVARVSLYKPENGPAVNAFVGVHVGHYFSVQANYVWNRNDLTLLSSLVSPQGGAFYEQGRESAQYSFVADGLVYFRALDSVVRPYLSTGVGIVHFDSDPLGRSLASDLAPPVGEIASTRLALRVAVGLDLILGGGWSFRYSFSETLSDNPISADLTPPGQRKLANFQNLFGILRRL